MEGGVACLAQRCAPSKFMPNHAAKEESSSVQPSVCSYTYHLIILFFSQTYHKCNRILACGFSIVAPDQIVDVYFLRVQKLEVLASSNREVDLSEVSALLMDRCFACRGSCPVVTPVTLDCAHPDDIILP